MKPPVDHLGIARFGFDIAMFDKAGLVRRFDRHIRCFKRRVRIAALHETAAHDVALAVVKQQRGVGGDGFVNVGQRGLRGPLDGEQIKVEPIHGVGIAHHAGHRIAPVKHVIHGKNRLVDEAGYHTKGVQAGHVFGGQNSLYTGMFCLPRVQITKA